MSSPSDKTPSSPASSYGWLHPRTVLQKYPHYIKRGFKFSLGFFVLGVLIFCVVNNSTESHVVLQVIAKVAIRIALLFLLGSALLIIPLTVWGLISRSRKKNRQ